MPRVYDMTRRTSRTERIAAIADALLAARPTGEITLQALGDLLEHDGAEGRLVLGVMACLVRGVLEAPCPES